MKLPHLSHRSLLTTLLLALAFLFLTPDLARAQEYRGTISGQVADQEGAVVGKATVHAISSTNNYDVTTDSKGRFTIPFVQPGTYTVTAEKQGFKKDEHRGIAVDVSRKISVDFKLPIGQVNETVSVQENALQLNTSDASGGTVMDTAMIQNLPLNGRQVYQLLQLTPGVVFTQRQFGSGGFSGNRAWDTNNSYSITGQPGSFNQFLLNGAPVSIEGGGGAGTWNISPSVDAVSQFKVMTITFDAAYGRAGGGIINTTIKNGTPSFHGTAYDFWRNSILDANTYQLNQVNEAKPYHNEHQFGGTIGGPFLKHNAFFFFNYEGYRQVLPGAITTTVPTADQFPGADGTVNLTSLLASLGRTNGIYDPTSTTCIAENADGSGCKTYGRAQFANNTIPANRISPIGLNIMKLFPAPNRPGYINNYVFNGKNQYSYNMPIARVDYNFSDKTRFYWLFAWWAGHEYRNGNGLVGPAIQGNINNYRSSLTQVLDLTHTFSPSIVSDVRLSFNRYYTLGPDGTVRAGLDTLSAADLGLAMPNLPTTTKNYAPEIGLGDNLPGVIGNTGDPNVFETYDLGPSVTQTVGPHTLHYGAEISLYHFVTGGVGQPNGNFGFSTAFTQNNPFQGNKDGSVVADLLLGYPGSGSVQYNYAPYESYKYFAGYIQDDWKVSQNVTINAGLRWDKETSPVERHHRLLAGMCLTCPNPISDMINYPANNTLANGASFVNPILGTIQYASNDLTAYRDNNDLFQPKIGLSWQPAPNIVFHMGYTLTKAFGIELGGGSTFSQSTNFNASPDGGLTPTSSFNSGIPYPNGYITPPGRSLGALGLVGTSFGIDMRDHKIPHFQQWTFGMQTRLPFQMLAEINYLGDHTTGLRTSRQLNGLSAADFARGHADPNYLDQQVTNPFYGVLPNTVSLGQNPTIEARDLMVPYPQFNDPNHGGLYSYTHATGYSNYNALLAKIEKRFQTNGVLVKGLSFLGSFTWSHLLTANGYLNNNGSGLVDPLPYYAVDGGDIPWSFSISGLYGLPIGKGGFLLGNAHGILGAAVNDWQLNWIFNNSAGLPVSFPNTYNYNCGGAYNIISPQRSYKSYINNTQQSCFSTFAEYTAVTQLPRTTVVRIPNSQQTALALQKSFPVKEGMVLNFKGEAFNFTNTPIFGAPNTGSPDQPITRVSSVSNPDQPGAWSGYGTVGSTQLNFPRQIQLSLKLQF